MNTDGLVFFGPGSEWFWLALQFTALTITFFAVFRELRAQQVEIRDNTKILRSQAHYNALMLLSRPWEIVLENESLASIVAIGLETPEALSAAEWLRCSNHMFLQLNSWEYLYYQNRDDSIPKEVWVGGDSYYRQQVGTKPGLSHFWDEYAAVFAEPFRSYATEQFAKKPAPPEPS
jgi:hypothetical protein